MDQKLTPLFDTINPKRNQSPSETLIERIRAAQAANMGRQQDLIGQTQGKISELEKKPKATDYSALMAASDMLTGTQFLPAYKNIKEPDTTKEELLQMRGLLGKQYEQLSDSELGALKAEYDALTDAKKFDMMEKMYSRKATEAGAGLTPGQEALDKAFAKEYSDWTAGGGYSNVAGNLDTLNKAIETLGGEAEMGKSYAPEFVRSFSDPEGLSLQQEIESVAQQSLKAVLGGQFGEKEGALFIKRFYDPRLPDSENIKKLNQFKMKIEAGARKKQEAMDYFERKGSLNGFKGNSTLTLGQFTKDLQKELLTDETKDTKDKKAPVKDAFDDLPADRQDALKKQFNL